MSIRAAIQQGDIECAIERANDLNPEILDTNPELMFHLKQQQLIELIKKGDIPRALEFAQEEMAPLGEEDVRSCEGLFALVLTQAKARIFARA